MKTMPTVRMADLVVPLLFLPTSSRISCSSSHSSHIWLHRCHCLGTAPSATCTVFLPSPHFPATKAATRASQYVANSLVGKRGFNGNSSIVCPATNVRKPQQV